MKKRMLSLLCVLALCLGLLPVTALAADGIDLYVGGQLITESGCYENQDGTWTKVDGAEPSSGQFYYDADTVTLTLNQAVITHDQTVKVAEGYTYEGSVIAFSQTADVSLTIVVSQGTSTITGTGGIRVESTTGNASLSIKGPGSLDVEPKGSNSGITLCSSKNTNLDIDGADVTASSPAQHGVYLISSTDASSTSTITVNNGSLTTGGNGNVGIYYYWSGAGNAGTSSLTVSGNAVVDTRNSQIMTQNKETVVQVGAGSDGNGGIVFNGKNGTVYGNVTLDDPLTVGAGETLTIPEGSTLTVPEGATLTNDGTVTIQEGGTLNGADTINNTGTINVESGGKLEGTPTGTGTVEYKVTGVTLDQTELALYTGESETLTATFQPANATNKNVTWQSSNPDVATVVDGTVTAVKEGEAIITVTTSDGGKQATCKVKVTQSTYGISADATALDFGSVYTGYDRPAAQTVTITNTGNQSLTLKQPASTNSFEVGTLSKTPLAPDEKATFTVQPKAGLAAGVYREEIQVSGSGNVTLSIPVSFSVQAAAAPQVTPAPAATPAPSDNITYYTCPSCGYHNWTATEAGYRCDHCGYLESTRQLSGYGNVKGSYTPGSSAAAPAASTIPQTGDESNPVLWTVLLLVSGLALGGLALRRKTEHSRS